MVTVASNVWFVGLKNVKNVPEVADFSDENGRSTLVGEPDCKCFSRGDATKKR